MPGAHQVRVHEEVRVAAITILEKVEEKVDSPQDGKRDEKAKKHAREPLLRLHSRCRWCRSVGELGAAAHGIKAAVSEREMHEGVHMHRSPPGGAAARGCGREKGQGGGSHVAIPAAGAYDPSDASAACAAPTRSATTAIEMRNVRAAIPISSKTAFTRPTHSRAVINVTSWRPKSPKNNEANEPKSLRETCAPSVELFGGLRQRDKELDTIGS